MPVLGLHRHVALLPELAHLKPLLGRQAASKRDLHLSGKDVRDYGVRIGDEAYLDLVDLRPPQYVAIVRAEYQVGVALPRAQLKRSAPHELHRPVRQLQEAVLVTLVRLPRMCSGNGTVELRAEHRICVDVRLAPVHDERAGVCASTLSTYLYPGCVSWARSLSWATCTVKRRSDEVNGAPSCHCAPSRIFQVVSMRPSGWTFHRPFSMLGTDSASCGRRTPTHRARSCQRTPESRARSRHVPSLRLAVFIVPLSVRGTSSTTAVSFLGVNGAVVWADPALWAWPVP